MRSQRIIHPVRVRCSQQELSALPAQSIGGADPRLWLLYLVLFIAAGALWRQEPPATHGTVVAWERLVELLPRLGLRSERGGLVAHY